jgi:hypothetical protein
MIATFWNKERNGTIPSQVRGFGAAIIDVEKYNLKLHRHRYTDRMRLMYLFHCYEIKRAVKHSSLFILKKEKNRITSHKNCS